MKEFWDPIKAYWSDHSEAHRKALNVLVVPATTTFQYADGVTDLSRISPDNWVHDQALLDRPGCSGAAILKKSAQDTAFAPYR